VEIAVPSLRPFLINLELEELVMTTISTNNRHGAVPLIGRILLGRSSSS
jgi:hypothetical protein